jgi:hypothetical protein
MTNTRKHDGPKIRHWMAASLNSPSQEDAVKGGTTLMTHPVSSGEKVTIYRLALLRRPFIEGRATVIGPVLSATNLYQVRFDNERRSCRRLLHPGAWQSDPDQLLAALTGHWRVTISPELVAELPPGGPGLD